MLDAGGGGVCCLEKIKNFNQCFIYYNVDCRFYIYVPCGPIPPVNKTLVQIIGVGTFLLRFIVIQKFILPSDLEILSARVTRL